MIYVLNKKVSTTLIVKNSRFINELFPCTTQQQAKDLIKAQKTKYADASHVVHAFVLGFNCEVLGSSDAGEPSGTAGRPMLEVLKGSNATNLLLTVTRYFGGTLLGTGGLVKAYSQCAKSAIDEAISTTSLEEYVAKKTFSFTADYALYDTIKRLMQNYAISNLIEDFALNVTVKGKIVDAEYDSFVLAVKNLSAGKISVTCITDNF